MTDSKVLLFYKFAPLPDPLAVKMWQKSLCEKLGLRGRLLISQDGINGTLGGTVQACKAYVKELKSYPPFADVDMKWSEGTGIGEDGFSRDFPRLSVKVRDEIVAFGAPGELKVGPEGVIGGGVHIKPEEVENLIDANPDLVFFDGRNKVEWEIGRFEGAVVPNTTTTHDFIAELESGKFDDIKDKPILTYCTGGIRCEVLSVLMKNRGFTQVYQLDGGIVRYGEKFANSGRWQGSLTVFDNREVVDFDGEATKLAQCHTCGAPAGRLHNCDEPSCRTRMPVCEDCVQKAAFCDEHLSVNA
ncbi:oxygen-dependent tRNA uridine(34) hydroxylase TrhO [Arcanobacterium canis]